MRNVYIQLKVSFGVYQQNKIWTKDKIEPQHIFIGMAFNISSQIEIWI